MFKHRYSRFMSYSNKSGKFFYAVVTYLLIIFVTTMLFSITFKDTYYYQALDQDNDIDKYAAYISSIYKEIEHETSYEDLFVYKGKTSFFNTVYDKNNKYAFVFISVSNEIELKCGSSDMKLKHLENFSTPLDNDLEFYMYEITYEYCSEEVTYKFDDNTYSVGYVENISIENNLYDHIDLKIYIYTRFWFQLIVAITINSILLLIQRNKTYKTEDFL